MPKWYFGFGVWFRLKVSGYLSLMIVPFTVYRSQPIVHCSLFTVYCLLFTVYQKLSFWTLRFDASTACPKTFRRVLSITFLVLQSQPDTT